MQFVRRRDEFVARAETQADPIGQSEIIVNEQRGVVLPHVPVGVGAGQDAGEPIRLRRGAAVQPHHLFERAEAERAAAP